MLKKKKISMKAKYSFACEIFRFPFKEEKKFDFWAVKRK